MANKKKLPIDFTLFSKVQLSAFISLMVISLILGVGIPIFLSSNMLLSVKTTREYKANELSDEDLISPIAFTFIDEERSSVENISSVEMQHVGMFLAMYQLRLAMLVRFHVDRVQTLHGLKHSFCGEKECSSIIGLLEVQLLVALVVSLLLRLKKCEPYFFVIPMGRIFQQVVHQLFCLVEGSPLLDHVFSLCEFFFLCAHTQRHYEKYQTQDDSCHCILLV